MFLKAEYYKAPFFPAWTSIEAVCSHPLFLLSASCSLGRNRHLASVPPVCWASDSLHRSTAVGITPCLHLNTLGTFHCRAQSVKSKSNRKMLYIQRIYCVFSGSCRHMLQMDWWMEFFCSAWALGRRKHLATFPLVPTRLGSVWLQPFFHFDWVPSQCAWSRHSNVSESPWRHLYSTQMQHNNGGHQGNGIPAAWFMHFCQTLGVWCWFLHCHFPCC